MIFASLRRLSRCQILPCIRKLNGGLLMLKGIRLSTTDANMLNKVDSNAERIHLQVVRPC